jgi:hypothetical protein
LPHSTTSEAGGRAERRNTKEQQMQTIETPMLVDGPHNPPRPAYPPKPGPIYPPKPGPMYPPKPAR